MSTRRRNKTAPVKVYNNQTGTLPTFLQELLAQQEEILHRNELARAKRLYRTNSPFYGVPAFVEASSPAEAAAIIEWHEERSHKITR